MPQSREQDVQQMLKRAEQIKHSLTEFATAGPLKNHYEQQHKIFFELSDQADEHESESVLDWFLFDWFDENGDGVIDHFLESNQDLSEEEQDILLDWEDSINSVFEIRSMGKHTIKLREVDSGDAFEVDAISSLDQSPFKRGQYIAARLLPLGDRFMFSGLQFIMPDRETAMEALEMRRALDDLDSPESLEKAQQEQCTAFCECFGCDELTVPSRELNSILAKFQHYLLAERRDPETGMTPAEKFEAEFGRELKIPDMPPLPEEITGVDQVTILCDEFDGIVVLPEYDRFKRIFETDTPDAEVPDWQELLWAYVKDPEIPIVAFERVAERHPQRLEKALSVLLEDEDFSLEHLYAVLLHFKNPVEGLDNLEDDELLWDLLNGNAPAQSNGGAKPRKAGGKTQTAKKASSKTKATGKAKAAGKASGKAASAARRATASKQSAKKGASLNSDAKSTKGAAKQTSAAKRATKASGKSASKGAARKAASATRKAASKAKR